MVFTKYLNKYHTHELVLADSHALYVVGVAITNSEFRVKEELKLTRNQIAYAEHIRQTRADAETARANKAKENISQGTLDESIRSNKERERQNLISLDETSRHNRASESIGYGNIAVGYANIAQHDRQLAEVARSNKQQEYLRAVELNNIASRDADAHNVAVYRAATERMGYTEDKRSNLSREQISLMALEKDYLSILSNPFKFIVGG